MANFPQCGVDYVTFTGVSLFFFFSSFYPTTSWNEKRRRRKKNAIFFESHKSIRERSVRFGRISLPTSLISLTFGCEKKKKKIWEMISWRRFSLLLLLIGRDVDEERKPEASTSTFYPKRKERKKHGATAETKVRRGAIQIRRSSRL